MLLSLIGQKKWKYMCPIIEESYEDTIIGHLEDSGTAYLLLHIFQYSRACAAHEGNQALHMVM